MKPSEAFKLLSLAVHVAANVEKTIFLGPQPVPIPQQPPTLSDLNLHTLTPANSSVRTRLDREFPKTADEFGEETRGLETWLLLNDLIEGQRYEVRVCWAAIEPTSFDLETFQLSTVWETPSLIQSLASYAYAHQGSSDDEAPRVHHPPSDELEEKISSVLLLRVVAAADYYSDNADLMSNPPPVLVDLILDPFLLNVLPRSLLPTAGYIVAIALVSIVVARLVTSYLSSIARPIDTETTKKKQ